MERCDVCNVPAQISPVYLRLMEEEGELVGLRLCARCQTSSNEHLRETIALWLPPYDRRQLGIGA